jgi:glycosyltransferase involved in cell wall biosynthesis
MHQQDYTEQLVKKPILSILIPTYNVEHFVEECLDSVLKQVDDRCEIIIYDDKSTDQTLEKVKQNIINNDQRVILICADKNQGLSHARNKLVSLSTGEFIWFIDSDDKIFPGAIDKILQIVKTHDPDIIAFDFVKLNTDLKQSAKKNKERHSTFKGSAGFFKASDDNLFISTIRSSRLYSWARVFRREVFRENIIFPEGQLFEDISTTPILIRNAGSLFYICEPLYMYRIRPGSIVSGLSTNNSAAPMLALNLMVHRYESAFGPMSDLAKKATTGFAAMQIMGSLKEVIRSPLSGKEKQLIIKVILNSFKNTHSRDIKYAIKASLSENGFFRTKRFLKWLIFALYVMLRNTP